MSPRVNASIPSVTSVHRREHRYRLIPTRLRSLPRILIAILAMIWSATAFAQTDEIQVYDAEIAEPGVFNLMVHNNYTFNGLTSPRFPGGLVAEHALNGVPEWAYGSRIGSSKACICRSTATPAISVQC
jgi:hypothetical protein